MNRGKAWMITMLAALLLVSCVPQRKIRYFQDKSRAGQTAFSEPQAQEYRVKPGDNLFIRIKSLDNEANAFDEGAGATNYYSGGGIYFNGYSVDAQGMIRFPLIGKIEVQQLTMEEIQKKIDISERGKIRASQVHRGVSLRVGSIRETSGEETTDLYLQPAIQQKKSQ